MWRACLLLAALAAFSCKKEPAPTPAEKTDPSEEAEPSACIADRVGELRVTDPAWRDDCDVDDTPCLRECLAGDANACFNRARAMERADRPIQAAALFERGCEVGDSISCINYGAGVWVDEPDDDTLRCVERIFEKTCEAGSQLGCGMRGRVMLDLVRTPEDRTALRTYLEQSCERVKGFACRVLAYYFESNELGAYDAARIPGLLTAACEGGDSESCGAKTASETFH